MSIAVSAARVATRGSLLALAQARLVEDALERIGIRSERVLVETEGDLRAPDTPWGEGAFVKEIERALLERRADVAVHSAKDVPTEADPRLTIAAYLAREDARDALVVREDVAGRDLASLPAGARLGTDSPRRSAFLRAIRSDLRVVPIHGNVDTRLRRLDAGEAEGLVLAVAGLVRLGRDDRIAERLDPRLVPPAPGQGAIAVQVRAGDGGLIDALGAIDHAPTRMAVEAERAFLRVCGGGCRAPVGSLAVIEEGRLVLEGGFADPRGRAATIDRIEGDPAHAEELAAMLAARLAQVMPLRLRTAGRRILVTRAANDAPRLAAALARVGLEPVVVPAIAISPVEPATLETAVRSLPTHDWAVVTSRHGVAAMVHGAALIGQPLDTVRWAAVGRSTAAALRRAGIVAAFVSDRATGADLGDSVPLRPGERVLVIRGDLAADDVPARLRSRGAAVDEVTAYLTVEAPEPSGELLDAALAGPPLRAIVFTSGSSVRGLLSLAGSRGDRLRRIPAATIGPRTRQEAEALGFSILVESPDPSVHALASALAEALDVQEAEVA